MFLGEGFDLGQHQLQAGALAGRGLAPDQVQRLDAGGAFIQRGDARIAGQLFHAVCSRCPIRSGRPSRWA
ncbi:hypothetical protein G6F46_015248 [Rhizopus delemar]|nr:hypothetical protein G6F59_017459 [Rhizopus arrhizus]KAG1582302.1 hypothetical protein G6F46_015248 [Rhizopus delemar]